MSCGNVFNVAWAHKCRLGEYVRLRCITKCERARILRVQTSYHPLLWAGVYLSWYYSLLVSEEIGVTYSGLIFKYVDCLEMQRFVFMNPW